MSLFRKLRICAGLSLIVCAAGCRSTAPRTESANMGRAAASPAREASTSQSMPSVPSSIADVSTVSPTAHVETVSYQQQRQRTPATVSIRVDDPFASQGELLLPQLIVEVQARNPSLQAMVAAWQSAAQRYPQVVALDDPTFMSMMAPASFGSSNVESAYVLQGGQKLPWFGKRAARGRAARADANAAYFDVVDNRLRLAEVAQLAFFDYYLVRRDLELNTENTQVMKQFRETANTKYKSNQVSQQDILQAEVELIDLDRRRIELERMDEVAVARINTLLRREPNAPLPGPPRQLDRTIATPPSEALQQLALERRPDLASLRARTQAEQAAVTVALKQYYPDVEVFGRYDSFWQPASTQSDLRGQVGVNLNVPIYRGKLNAAVREAMLRVSQRRAEYQQQVLDIQYEVQTAHAQLQEARKTVKLYSERFIPTAEQNVAAARANYDVGKMSFLGLAQAQRQLIELRERQQEAIANYHRRLAELQRVIGGPIPQEEPGIEVVPAPIPR